MKKILTTLILATLTQIGFSQDITNPKDYSQVGEDNEVIYYLNNNAYSFPKTKGGKVIFGSVVKLKKRDDGQEKYVKIFIEDSKDCIKKHGDLLIYDLDDTYLKTIEWNSDEWDKETAGGLTGVAMAICVKAFKLMDADSKRIMK